MSSWFVFNQNILEIMCATSSILYIITIS